MATGMSAWMAVVMFGKSISRATSMPDSASRNAFVTAVRRACDTREWNTMPAAARRNSNVKATIRAKTIALNCSWLVVHSARRRRSAGATREP